MVVGLVAGAISLTNHGSYVCADVGCRSLAGDNAGAMAAVVIGGGSALAGVGLIIAGATLDGPIVPAVSPPRPPPPPPAPPPPPPRRRGPQLQMGRIF
jgi:hypothetical protein